MRRILTLISRLENSLVGDLIGAVCLFAIFYLSLHLEILT